ncbi:MAG: ACT domain-containing protein [Pseudomonadota bacterium]
MLKSSRAKAKVRQWFKQQDLETHIQEGRALLERELHRLNLSNVNLDKLATRLKFTRTEDLFAALGRGDVGTTQLDRILHDEFAPPQERPVVAAAKRKAETAGVLVEGEPGVLTQMAGCCKPAPPDPVLGYITQGHGITIHRADCPVILHLPEDRQARLLRAEWGERAGSMFAVDMELVASDRSGLLKDVTEILAQEKTNVVRLNTNTQQDTAYMSFTLEVSDIAQLTRCLARLGQVRGVQSTRRK